VGGNPKLLRRRGRRVLRRLVFVGILATVLLVAPSASGLVNDVTPPVITVRAFGTLGSDDGKPATDGWFVSNVTVNWRVDDPESPILWWSGCDPRTLNTDTPQISLTCSATSEGGGPVSVTKTFTIDKSAPTVGAAPTRQPDANGWYNQPLTVAFSGTDAMSGIQSCSSAAYSGPDNGAATVNGSCRDNAGNVAVSAFAFKYDATPPGLMAVKAKLRNRSAEVTWRKSADTLVVEVLRAPGRKGQGETVVYRGSETGFRDTGLVVGRKYEYRVTGFDQAANRSDHTIEIVARGALLNPAPGAHVTSPPTLAWTPVRKASYYNLQLIRGRKVLSVWTLRPSFQMRRAWIYKGRRYRMKPGVYRWFVWPGFGRIKAANYGRLLGSSTFVVVGKAPRR
jgi:hypothetical protein